MRCFGVRTKTPPGFAARASDSSVFSDMPAPTTWQKTAGSPVHHLRPLLVWAAMKPTHGVTPTTMEMADAYVRYHGSLRPGWSSVRALHPPASSIAARRHTPAVPVKLVK